jgi:hypothetical protein
MSYLDVPRLHFAGYFIANPSTINNTPSNFDPTVPINFQNESWNPNGNASWTFLNCTVRSAINASGQVYPTSGTDPVIGAAVLSTNQPVPAKLVDLDTQQQGVSEIWGLHVRVAISDTDYFEGDFRVVCFNDINFSRVVDGVGDSAASAYYQSFLDNVTWGSQLSSPFLQELQSASPTRLSIKFIVDGFNDDSNSLEFTQGRIVGTIGPAHENEPPNFVLGRSLRPPATPPNSILWFGYARVDATRQKVLVDLGNSIPTTSPGGQPPNLGALMVAINPSGKNPIILGSYGYSESTYLEKAGIQEYDVTPDQIKMLANTPLGVLQVLASTPQGQFNVLLQEGQNGTYINATQQVYRMNPGDVEKVELIALQFGAPAPGQKINLQLYGDQFGPTPPPVCKPSSGLTFLKKVTTGADGRVSFKITAAAPGNPRKFIDGQIYGVQYNWGKDADSNFPADPNEYVNVLVFDSFEKPPTWANLKPILDQYAKLYPFMDSIFQLNNPVVIQQNIAAFQMVLNIADTDPRYMPVTRDMSRDKRQRILEWLNNGAPTT